MTPEKEILIKLNEILAIHKALPTWLPLTQEYAKECGYKTLDGLRKWCCKNLHPDLFVKKGNQWYIHISAIHIVKRKVL